MGVYIKVIDKPKECCDCPFNIGVCIVNVAVFGKEPLHEPGEWWCPLVAVPDHGDLVDIDNLYYMLGTINGAVRAINKECVELNQLLHSDYKIIIPEERSEA